MVLREKNCKYCKLWFQYEDGIDSHGVAVSTQESRLSIAENERRPAYCPQCHDPHKIRGMSYYKSTILKVLKRHLQKHGIQTSFLDAETLIGMLKEFPKSAYLYASNGTFRTFTLLPGLEFEGKYGNFILGNVSPYFTSLKKKPKAQIKDLREVTCSRCKFTTKMSTVRVLTFYLGIELKTCKKCDGFRNYSDGNSNLPKPKKSEYSDISLARALNVSRNDFVRHEISKPEPPLPLESIVNGLRIIEAYWDESTYSPKYKMFCEKCRQTFTILQKQVHLLEHWC